MNPGYRIALTPDELFRLTAFLVEHGHAKAAADVLLAALPPHPFADRRTT